MSPRSLLLPLLLLFAALSWWAWPQLRSRLPGPPAAEVLKPLQPLVQAVQADAAPPPQRCRAADGARLYVQGDCPAGTRAEALGGGTVNVLPAPATPATPAASTASAPPALRRLADPEGTAELQRRRLERAVNP